MFIFVTQLDSMQNGMVVVGGCLLVGCEDPHELRRGNAHGKGTENCFDKCRRGLGHQQMVLNDAKLPDKKLVTE